MNGEAVVNDLMISVFSEAGACGSDLVCSVSGSANGVLTSTFTISGTESAFIAGYGDLTWSDFKSGYNGYYYQDTSVIDAEKCSAITQDNMMCWAGTAANMLYYTGWGLVGADTEDKVFSVFINNFLLGETYGGNAYHAIDWYFTGHYSPQTWSEWDIPLENSGGFYSETFKTEQLSSYLSSTTFTVSGLTTAKQKLEAGYGVGVTFGYYNSKGTRTGGHLITLWGMTCDSSYSVTDPRYYTGIIVTDSDDNKSVSDPLSAPDTLKIISITYDSSLGAYLIDPDYAGANSRLEHLTFLAPNTNAFPDGSGLVLVYSSGTLVKKGPVMTRETLVAGINDSMSVNSGGAASGTCVSSGGFMAVSSGGTAAETAVYQGGSVVVFSGGTAGDTIVSRGGSMVISSGGTAGDTCVFSGGSMVVSSGGGVLGAEIYSRGGANILGSANNVTVYSGGSLRINAGTVVSGVSATEGAFFGIAVGSKSYIQGSYAGSSFEIRGGVVSNYSVNSGYLSILGGAGAGGVTVKDHGLLRAGLRGTASNTVVSSGGSITLEGGKHTHTLTMADGAFVSAGNGGIIDFTVSARSVSDGYLINDLSLIQGTPVYTITVSADQAQGVYKLAQGADGFKGTLTIGNGTIDYGTITVNGADLVYGNVAYSLDLYKGDLTLNIGNVAPAGDQVKVYSSGTLVKQGKVLTCEMIFSGANDSMYVSSGGVAESTKVSSGFITVFSGGAANNTLIDPYGRMYVQSGGAISNTLIAGDNGVLFLLSGAAADNTSMTALGNFTVEGTANHVTLDNQGRMFVSSGGEANNVTGNGMVTIRVGNSGTVNSVSLTGSRTDSGLQRPALNVVSGGVANKVKGYDWSVVYVSGGGFASDVSVGRFSLIRVDGEEYTPEGGDEAEALYGSAKNVTVHSGGTATVRGGEVSGLLVSSGGIASVAGVADVSAVDVYGKLYSAEVKSGGKLTIGSGGVELWEDTVLGGTVTVNGFANIYGELVFDLSERSAGDTYIVDNIANLNLTEIGSYTISVSDNQVNGTYKLAGNAASFSNTVTVEGTALSVNGAGAIIGDKQYTLAVTDSILTLTIGTAPAGDQVQVYSGSTLVNRGTILTGETIVGGANNTMYVYSGGTANITTVNSEGWLHISSGGVANSTTVNASGWMNISSGGVANSTTLSGNATTWAQAGHLRICSGGVANETTVDFGGRIDLYGGAVNKTVLNSGGFMVAQGGTASQVTINDAAVLLYSDAVLIDATNNGGTIAVSSGGVASNLTAELVQIASSDYARIAVWSGGVANTVKLDYTGWLHVAGGGFASDVSVSSRGRLYVWGEEYTPEGGEMAEALYGSARGVTVSSGGSALINGGEVTGLMVSSGGITSVCGVADVSAVDVYGKLYGGEIQYGGTLTIGSGGVELWEDTVLGGTVTVNGFANIYGELVFDLSERSGEDTYIVDNIANLNLTETGSYTITVSENQANGAYKLAGNASSFNDTITVEGTALSVNGSGAIIGDRQYTFAVTDSILTLTIGTAPAGEQVQVYSGSTLVNRGTILTGETIVGGANDIMNVYSGGTASDTRVSSAASMRVFSGGVANNTQVDGLGIMTVFSGGVINGAVLNSGALYAQGGTASEVTLKNGARVYLYSGAVLIDAINNGGGMGGIAVYSGAVASNLSAEMEANASAGYAITRVSSGGVANTVKLGYRGNLYVSGGGFASDVSVSSRGFISVRGEEYTPEGGEMAEALYGSAKNVTVHSGGTVIVSGGEVSGLLVSSGGIASVFGVADVSAVDVYGKLYSAEVKSGGKFTIGSGGVELWEDTVFGGTVTVNGFANIYGELIFDLSERSGEDTYIVDNIANLNLTEIGSYTISISENQANGAYKLAGNASSFNATITVEGTALSVNGSGAIIGDRQYTLAVTDSILTLTIGTAPAGDQVKVYSGSTLVNRGTILTGETIVGGANDIMNVYSGGTANITTVNSEGWLRISSGGVANSTTVNASGWMNISSGGVANSTTLSGNAMTAAQAGHLRIYSGGVANETTVDFGGRIDLYGGAVNGAVLNSGGVLTARGGTASQVTLRQAVVHLYSGAVLIDATNNGGTIAVSSGGVASNVFAEMEATASSGYTRTLVSSGGVANTVKLGYRGNLYVSGGGFASDVSVSNNGRLFVIGEEYTPEGGEMAEALYGSARGVTVSSGGSALISGGEVAGLMVSSGGYASVAGVADVSAVDVYGKLYGGEIKYGGTLTIGSGGTVDTIEVKSGGAIYYSAGAILAGEHVYGGRVAIEGYVDAENADVTFDVSQRLTADSFIVSNLAYLNAGSFSITVAADQEKGTYMLAENADGFAGSLSVGTGTVNWGTVSVNGEQLTYNETVYKLVGESGNLHLVIEAADREAPELTITGNATEWTNRDVVLQVVCDDPEAVVSFRIDNGDWQVCTGTLTVRSNCSIEFRAVDRAGNTTTERVIVDKIDNVAPEAPKVTADITDFTNQSVTLTADYGDAVKKEFSYNNRTWYTYNGGVVLNSNSTVYFRGSDALGNVSGISSYKVDNIDKAAPGVPGEVTIAIDGNNAVADWNDVGDSGVSGVKGYFVRTGNSENMTGHGTFVEASRISLENLAEGVWYCQIASVDKAGNISEWSTVKSFVIGVPGPENLVSTPRGLSWDAVEGASGYVVEYSYDDFESAVAVETATNALDSFALPGTTFKWRVRALESSVWSFGSEVTGNGSIDAEEIVSDNDGNTDLFFANANDLWGKGYAAENKFTGERIMLAGKNRLDEIFEGSSDADVLVLTDDLNGDALFVDDIYTALGDRARMEEIDEIRAGAGADVIDMTSLRYGYSGKEITIHGGDGDDVIWTGGTDSVLFGDAGDDRLAGSTCFDVFAGGSGNDTMCSGGGNDIFVFSGEFGNDTVEITDYSEVTLWFDAGSSEKWDPVRRIYRSGSNSVTVTGSGAVDLKFGDEGGRYAEFAEAGLFDDVSSRKIFEEKDKGMLA